MSLTFSAGRIQREDAGQKRREGKLQEERIRRHLDLLKRSPYSPSTLGSSFVSHLLHIPVFFLQVLSYYLVFWKESRNTVRKVVLPQE